MKHHCFRRMMMAVIIEPYICLTAYVLTELQQMLLKIYLLSRGNLILANRCFAVFDALTAWLALSFKMHEFMLFSTLVR
jgi:hypothetical protein